jgi:hypothetical protein
MGSYQKQRHYLSPVTGYILSMASASGVAFELLERLD